MTKKQIHQRIIDAGIVAVIRATSVDKALASAEAISAGGVFVLLVATAFIVTKGANSTQEIPTSYSSGSGGAKAAPRTLGSGGQGSYCSDIARGSRS